jgi:hypothetical protein
VTVSRALHEARAVILRRLNEETKTLEAEHWPVIRRVATALMTTNVLKQSELDALISERPRHETLPVS